MAFYQITEGGVNDSKQQSLPENQAPDSIVTIGRVCNMLGEISKRKNDYEAATQYYLKGLSAEPLGYLDNYVDLADICEILDQHELYTVVMTFAKVLNQVNDGNLQMEIDSIEDENSNFNQTKHLALTGQEWDQIQDATGSLQA